MRTDRRLVGAALGVALLVAACGGASATPTPPASQAPASQAPAASAAPSAAAASTAASEAPAGTPAPALSLAPGTAGDLEAMLPSSINGTAFQKTSVDGSQIAGAGTPIDTSKVDPLLSKYGKSLADVRIAIATSGTTSTGMPEMVYAIQIKGVPAAEWASEVGSGMTGGSSMTLGGKTVTGTTAGGFTTAYYPKDDILFLVVAPEKDADAIFAALP